ncbi:hypothetical protein TNCV_227251 [Trichonephila clavipes]|nr:hypothetical protein TNCV_227251 [Trichonephila clavipes]
MCEIPLFICTFQNCRQTTLLIPLIHLGWNRANFRGRRGCAEVSEWTHCSAKRWLLATDLVILSHGQGTKTTHELTLPSPNYHTTPTEERLSSRQI